MQRFILAMGMAIIALTAVTMSNAFGSGRPEVVCSADSGKAFSPVLTAQQICDRFMRALNRKAGTVRVDLRFSSKGLASAKTWQLRSGGWKRLPLLEMAVMDRPFNLSDIDNLAKDVASAMASARRTEKN